MLCIILQYIDVFILSFSLVSGLLTLTIAFTNMYEDLQCFLCHECRKVAQESLESAVRKLGGVEQLDAVWAEAEKIVKQALKPSPLQSKSQTSASAAPANQKPAAPAAAASASSGAAATAKPSAASAAAAAASKYNPYKTQLCKEYMETKKCKHGEYCLYAHGEKELKVGFSPKQSSCLCFFFLAIQRDNVVLLYLSIS